MGDRREGLGGRKDGGRGGGGGGRRVRGDSGNGGFKKNLLLNFQHYARFSDRNNVGIP